MPNGAAPDPQAVNLLDQAQRLFNREFLEPRPAQALLREWGDIRPLLVRPPDVYVEKGKRGEELFKLILQGIQEVYDVDAVIAGGAVRDFAAGVDDYKDVDVFIPLSLKAFWERKDELGWNYVDMVRMLEDDEEYSFKGRVKQPKTERGSAVVQNVKVDLVFVHGEITQDLIDSFPVYAQRCIWTLENGLQVSPKAQEDLNNKTFTLDYKELDTSEKQTACENKVKEWLKRPHYKGWKAVSVKPRPWYLLP